MPRLTSTVLTSYHTLVCTLCLESILLHVNIRSLLPKFGLFTALAHSANPDILAVSESWLRKATNNPEISIPNFNIF